MPSSTTPWSAAYSAAPTGRARRGSSLPALLAAIGRERVTHPGAEGGPPLSRLEILARVLWTRATLDGDLTAIKLLIECLQMAGPAAGSSPIEWTADDFAAAQALIDGLAGSADPAPASAPEAPHVP